MKAVSKPKAVVKKVKQAAVSDPALFEMKMVWGSNNRDAAPKVKTSTFADLIKQFEIPDTKRGTLSFAEYQALDKNDPEQKKIRGREKNGPYFIPATFKRHGVRTADEIDQLYGFVLDFDSGKVPQKEIEKKLKGITYVGYTSYSHATKVPRYRVLIPYAEPIDPSQHQGVFNHFNTMFNGDIDKRSETTNQLWYTPACPHDAAKIFKSFCNIGAPFDAASVIRTHSKAAPKEKTLARTAPASNVLEQSTAHFNSGSNVGMSQLEKVKDAMRFLDADDYDIWIKVGHALKHDFGDIGFKVWEDFAKQSKKFDEDESLTRWNSFKPKAKGPITVRSIVHIAKEKGWIEPPDTLEPAISKLNSNCFLALEGGNVNIYREDIDSILDRRVITRMSPTAFRLLHRNKMITLPGGKSKNLAEHWLDHPLRREYDGIIFAPGLERANHYNLWKGFSVSAKRGKWKLMRKHIQEVICSNDKACISYLLNWMAFAVQFPGVLPGVAVVMKGGRGTGKGKVATWFGRLFGQHFIQATDPRHVVGNFNAHLRDASVLFCDEAIWAGDKTAESTLKGMITESTRLLEQKGVDPITIQNYLHIIMASNNDWVVPAGNDERRFFVVEVSDAHKQDHKYFEALDKEMNNGGLAAMLYDLQRRDLSAFNIRSVPRTKALDTQKMLTFSPVERWLFQRLKEGEICGLTWGQIATRALFEDYKQFTSGSRGYQRADETLVGIALKDLLPTGYPKRKKATLCPRSQQAWIYEFPPLADCRKHFEKHASMEGYVW